MTAHAHPRRSLYLDVFTYSALLLVCTGGLAYSGNRTRARLEAELGNLRSEQAHIQVSIERLDAETASIENGLPAILEQVTSVNQQALAAARTHVVYMSIQKRRSLDFTQMIYRFLGENAQSVQSLSVQAAEVQSDVSAVKANLNQVAASIEALKPPPEAASADEIAALKSDERPADPVWNLWFEDLSDHLAFKPLPKLFTNDDYSLVVDLSAIEYGKLTGLFSSPAASPLDDWLYGRPPQKQSVDIEIVLSPDEKYLSDQSAAEGNQYITVYLNRISAVKAHGFEWPKIPFEYLKKYPDPGSEPIPITFGRKILRIHTKEQSGLGTIMLFFLVNGRILDEIALPVCIVTSEHDACDGLSHPYVSTAGVDFVHPGDPPDIAVDLVERDANSVAGVFRCNTCAGSAASRTHPWLLEVSASDLVKKLSDEVIFTFENASRSNLVLASTAATGQAVAASNAADSAEDIQRQYRQAGDALRKLVFGPAAVGTANDVDTEFTKAIAEVLASNGSNGSGPPSIFFRFLPRTRTLTFTVPVDMMTVDIPPGKKDFLGFHFLSETPLAEQDYSPGSSCISRWVFLVPPQDVQNPSMHDARSSFGNWANPSQSESNSSQQPLQLFDDLGKFDDWIKKGDDPADNYALVTLSHHIENKLCFVNEFCTGGPSVLSLDFNRHFNPPSLAVINACGTAKPGASEFVTALNDLGVNAFVATSTTVDGRMAGRFAEIFLRELKDHPAYSVSRAKFEAVKELSGLAIGTEGQTYGPQVLGYTMLGNAGLKVCTPQARKP